MAERSDRRPQNGLTVPIHRQHSSRPYTAHDAKLTDRAGEQIRGHEPRGSPPLGPVHFSRMAVVFRLLHPDPDAETDEVFDNGEGIPQALIHTEDLPKGFPTERFAPQLVNGRYAIRADIDVARGKLLLSPRPQRGQMDGVAQPLS